MTLDDSPFADHWDETARGLARVVANLNSTWYGKRAVYYSREKEALESKYIKPFQYGAVTTVLLFFSLRLTGSRAFIQWRNSWRSNPKNTAQPVQIKGYLEQERQQRVNQALNSVKVLSDILISISVATSCTLFALLQTSPDEMKQDLAQAPLQTGQSIVGEEFCPELTYSPTMPSFLKETYHNCQKRKEMESRLQSQQQLSPQAPVVIPYDAWKS